jgi:hypothetical protein
MTRKTLKVTFIVFVLAMVFFFFYFGLGFSKNSGWQVSTFILNDKAKIAGLLVLLSYPVYKILKKRIQP